MKKLIPLIILSIFGIIFMSLLVHEGIHVMQSKSPSSICYDMQQATFMSVTHSPEDFEDEEFQDFKTYSEKWASITEKIFQIIISIGLGVVFMCWIYALKNKRGGFY